MSSCDLKVDTLTIANYSPEGEYWTYSTGQKNSIDAFGYNSTKSEPIWMKSGTALAKCWALALADFGHDPHKSDSLRRSLNFAFFLSCK